MVIIVHIRFTTIVQWCRLEDLIKDNIVQNVIFTRKQIHILQI